MIPNSWHGESPFFCFFFANLIYYNWCRISSINTIGVPEHFYVAGPPSDGVMLSEATYSQSGEYFKELLNRTGHQPAILLVADGWGREGLDDHRRWWKQKKTHANTHATVPLARLQQSLSSNKCFWLLHVVSSCHLHLICSSDLPWPDPYAIAFDRFFHGPLLQDTRTPCAAKTVVSRFQHSAHLPNGTFSWANFTIGWHHDGTMKKAWSSSLQSVD